MSPPEIKEGVAVRYPGTGPAIGRDRAHTQVIITNPDHNGVVFLVSICTFHRLADPTCVIEPDGSWEPIIRKSYAAYYCIAGVTTENLTRRISRQEVTYLGPVPDDLYKRIKDGVTISKETPEFVKKALLRQAKIRRPPGRILRSNPPSS